jgi:hypothetical protein
MALAMLPKSERHRVNAGLDQVGNPDNWDQFENECRSESANFRRKEAGKAFRRSGNNSRKHSIATWLAVMSYLRSRRASAASRIKSKI